MKNLTSKELLLIQGPVYAMNSKISRYLKANPIALPVAVTCYNEYYKAVQKAAKLLRRQMKLLITGAEVKIGKKQ